MRPVLCVMISSFLVAMPGLLGAAEPVVVRVALDLDTYLSFPADQLAHPDKGSAKVEVDKQERIRVDVLDRLFDPEASQQIRGVRICGMSLGEARLKLTTLDGKEHVFQVQVEYLPLQRPDRLAGVFADHMAGQLLQITQRGFGREATGCFPQAANPFICLQLDENPVLPRVADDKCFKFGNFHLNHSHCHGIGRHSPFFTDQRNAAAVERMLGVFHVEQLRPIHTGLDPVAGNL